VKLRISDATTVDDPRAAFSTPGRPLPAFFATAEWRAEDKRMLAECRRHGNYERLRVIWPATIFAHHRYVRELSIDDAWAAAEDARERALAAERERR
jgi:hypothetical protein